jgi:hypothetical protein
MNKPLELQLSIYDPNQQKIKAAITFNIKPNAALRLLIRGGSMIPESRNSG